MINFKTPFYAMMIVAGIFSSQLSYADTTNNNTAAAEPIWIDVRTARESKIDHIEGDLRMSHFDIDKEVMKLYPDRSTKIGVYGSNGTRSGLALYFLLSAGYENVFNAESIDQVRKIRGLDK